MPFSDNMPKNKPQKNIPKGWRQVKLGDACDIVMGQSPSSSAYNENFIGIPLVQGNNDIKKGKTIERIYTSEITKTSVKDSIILTVRAPVGCVGVAHKRICIGRGVCSINTKKENQNFIFYFLKFFEPKWTSLEQGSTFTAVNSSDIRKLKFLLPPLPEQNRIVGVLGVWDEYLGKLARKIEIKRKIKKGLMQTLLSGRVRLKGFGGDWEKVRLGDVCKRIRTGKLNANAMVKNGDYRFYTCAKEYYKINNYAFNTEALLVSGNGANVGYIHYYKGKFNAYQRTYVLDKFTSDIFFTKYILDKNLKQRIYLEKCDGNTPYIKINTLTDMMIKMPKFKEQIAIAEILIVADREIEVLEKKKKIIEAQKKYLLNNLITGKIRVPV